MTGNPDFNASSEAKRLAETRVLQGRLTFTRAQVEKLKEEILTDIPGAYVETWQDFGFCMEVRVGDRICVATAPKSDRNPAIFLDITEIRRLLFDE